MTHLESDGRSSLPLYFETLNPHPPVPDRIIRPMPYSVALVPFERAKVLLEYPDAVRVAIKDILNERDKSVTGDSPIDEK